MKPAASHHGFTLLELLVVIVVLLVLIALARPFYHRPGPGLQVRCFNNLRQMNLAWLIYASDSGEKLATNRPYGSTELPLDNWVAGVMDWTASPQSTNQDLLLMAGLSGYLKSAEVYHCPDDKSESLAGPRVRSYAMNGFLGNYGDQPNFPGWRPSLKLQEMRNPTGTFVFVDEQANSIDDGFFINNPDQTSRWLDLPAANHGKGAAGFGFVDGHAEMHKWVDVSTRQPVKQSGPKPSVQLGNTDSGADLAWVLKAMGAMNTNAVSDPPKLPDAEK